MRMTRSKQETDPGLKPNAEVGPEVKNVDPVEAVDGVVEVIAAPRNTPPGAAEKREFWERPDLIWSAIAVLGVVLVGALIIGRAERWKRRQLAGEDLGEVMGVGSYRQMLESGELSREEYDRILRRVGERKQGRVNPAPARQAPPKDSDPQPNQ
jgi:hypothetical protein